MGSSPEIILYTNYRCPYAHRAHVALEALKVSYQESWIDLDSPRTQEYLAINPRGLIPTIKYNGDIYTESAIVANFLADSYPGKLVPESSSPEGPQTRARVQFFADTWASKVQPLVFQYIAATGETLGGLVDRTIEQIFKELEPLLENTNPFFNGRKEIGLAEVLTGPFVIRFVHLSKVDVYPKRLATELAERAPKFWKWAEDVSAHPNVTAAFKPEEIVENTKMRMAKARA